MSRTIRTTLFGFFVAVVTVLALFNAATSGGVSTARTSLTLIAPASPGGGWDGFARDGQQALRAQGIVNNPQVINIPGAGGTIGLSQFVEDRGRGDALLVTGGVMVGAIELNDSPETFDDIVPIARMTDGYSVLVVPADSEIQTLDDFVEVFTSDPGGTSIAGGSLGSIDHLLGGLLAKEVGVDPADVNYIAYSGGGGALNSMLAGTTVAGISGYNEVAGQIEAGTLRPLAISAPEPVEGVDVPTFIEQGYDVSMANWRGVAAAPGITEEEKAELVEIVTEWSQTPEWQAAIERNKWTDSFQTGEELEQFIAEEERVAEEIVGELGL